MFQNLGFKNGRGYIQCFEICVKSHEGAVAFSILHYWQILCKHCIYPMEPIKAKNPKHLFVHNQIFLCVFNCGDLYPNAFSPSLVEKKKIKIDMAKHISPI